VAVVLALTIIALLLIALEHIKFDKEKVLQSVRDIIEVVTEIMTSIFGSPAQHDKPGSEILTLLGLPFKVLNMTLQGVGAAAWLILAVFSIAALVLISGLLKLISFDKRYVCIEQIEQQDLFYQNPVTQVKISRNAIDIIKQYIEKWSK